ncbi:TetR/AcrR family transcriptional regulator [Luteimonas sp. WGS1318]|uniref:TetR/AcrR family transcriptional regulator n=1 Tax=Luteimonas sp. WGS1318 TaxID=3366815 RepID=UPI00372D0FC6
MAHDTRQRILDGALALFNADGEPRVTTNHIAEALAISPGNLYYHVRSKDDIIGQLFARYEARMDAALVVPDDRPPTLEDLWLQLHGVFECIWDYRFLYRDLLEILSRNPRLRTRFSRILDRANQRARAVIAGLARAGILRASPAEIDAAATNLIVVATFWLNYSATRGQRDEQAAIHAGIVQVMMLLAPALRDAERVHLNALIRAYTD